MGVTNINEKYIKLYYANSSTNIDGTKVCFTSVCLTDNYGFNVSETVEEIDSLLNK